MKKRKWSLTITRFSSTLYPSTLPSLAPTNLRRTTSLISRLAVSGDFEAARRLLLSQPVTDAAAWNSLISASAKSGKTEYAFQIFDEMPHRPDEFTLSCLLKAASFISGINLSQMHILNI